MGRSRASAKAAGAKFERLVADYLSDQVDDRIDRRVSNGAKDKGDIAGVRHMGEPVVVECKNVTQWKPGTWLAEAEAERINDAALAGVVVAKRHGNANPGDQVVLMTLADFAALLIGERPEVSLVVTRWQVTKAVRASDLPSSSRLIMLVLADVAEVGTAEIPEQFTPSLAVLVRETGLTRTTIRAHLDGLEAAGWLKRVRPSKKEQWHGERVRYALLVPVGGGSTIVHEGGSVIDPVGQPLTEGGSTIDQKGVNDCPPNQILIKSDRGEHSSPPDARLFDIDEPAQPPKANTILAEWIDHCTANNVKLSSRVKSRYGERIKAALDEGFSAEIIRAALIRMRERGQAGSPAQLDGFLVDVQVPAQSRASPLPKSNAPELIPDAEKCDHGKRATTCGLCRAERIGRTP